MAILIWEIDGIKMVSFQTPAILDSVEVDKIGRQLYELVDGQAHRKILLDFRQVRQLSSQMLGTLIQLNKKSKAIKGKVVLCGLGPEVLKVLKTSRLDKLLHIAADEEQARQLFEASAGN